MCIFSCVCVGVLVYVFLCVSEMFERILCLLCVPVYVLVCGYVCAYGVVYVDACASFHVSVCDFLYVIL